MIVSLYYTERTSILFRACEVVAQETDFSNSFPSRTVRFAIGDVKKCNALHSGALEGLRECQFEDVGHTQSAHAGAAKC